METEPEKPDKKEGRSWGETAMYVAVVLFALLVMGTIVDNCFFSGKYLPIEAWNSPTP